MNAEDTIMNDEQIAEAFNKFYGRVIYSAKSIMPSDRAIVKAQAKISFEAGVKEVDKTLQISEQLGCVELITGVPVWIAVDWEIWRTMLRGDASEQVP